MKCMWCAPLHVVMIVLIVGCDWDVCVKGGQISWLARLAVSPQYLDMESASCHGLGETSEYKAQ